MHLDQAVRRRAGPRVELAVAQLTVFEEQRHLFRLLCSGVLEQVGQCFVAQQRGLLWTAQDVHRS